MQWQQRHHEIVLDGRIDAAVAKQRHRHVRQAKLHNVPESLFERIKACDTENAVCVALNNFQDHRRGAFGHNNVISQFLGAGLPRPDQARAATAPRFSSSRAVRHHTADHNRVPRNHDLLGLRYPNLV